MTVNLKVLVLYNTKKIYKYNKFREVEYIINKSLLAIFKTVIIHLTTNPKTTARCNYPNHKYKLNLFLIHTSHLTTVIGNSLKNKIRKLMS